MNHIERNNLQQSETYFFSPSQNAKRLYYYSICAGYIFSNEGFHVVRDKYDSILIIHIISGDFTYVKNGEHIKAYKGDTVILNCYNPHEYYASNNLQAVWCHVDGSSSLQLYEEIEKNNGNRIQSVDSSYIENQIFKIFEALKNPISSSEINISIDIYNLFMNLLNPQQILTNEPERYTQSIDELKSYIVNHLNEKLSVKFLADKMHMSLSHFSRIFKQYTGYSPYEYILSSRLNKAKMLLQKTNMSIMDIAIETGFNSESSFIVCFTDNIGMTPGKFRKLNFQ